jgi:hypothetical protein
VLLLLLLVLVGVPIVLHRYPELRQYPVTADLPQSFSDLSLLDDRASDRAATKLAEQLRDAGASSDAVFAGIYGDGDGKRVTIFGVTGWRFAPGSDVRNELDQVADDYDLDDVEMFNPGQFGVHESCGVGRDDGSAVVVCAWADHGSLATVILTRRSISDSADLVSRLRTAVLSPK